MAGPRTQRQPTFFWQGLLILLPVAVLAVVGAVSLRQDKIIARHDAIDRAQIMADDLAAKISNEFTAKESPGSNPSDALAFEVDSAGQLIFPPPAAPVPMPQPFELDKLNASQKQLWLKLCGPAADQQNFEIVVQDFKDFIGSQPPERFAAAASYTLGLVLAQRGKPAEAAELFARVAKQYPEEMGESGLPFQPLAQLKWLQLAAAAPDVIGTNSISVESLYSNIVYHPTLLTPELLKQAERLPAGHPGARNRSAERAVWERLWQNHEAARQLYAAARGRFFARTNPVPEAFTLVSTSGDDRRRVEPEGMAAMISFPRFFWFATPNLLFVPNVPGSSKEAAQNTYRSFVTMTRDSGSIWNSNAVTTVAHWISGSGTLDRDWLAIAAGDSETNRWYVCRGETEIVSRLNELLNRKPPIPDYLGIGIEVAGKRMRALDSNLQIWRYVGWNNPHSPGGGETKEYSGEVSTNLLASTVKSEAGKEWLKVSVYLTSPATLYQLQGARAFWFGALVAVSAGAALIGLLAAWRTFRQQRQLSKLKSNFVSSVSHELRAPIAAVRLMAENLESGKVPEISKQREYFGFILQECRRLSALIENVLDFSRIEQGRKQYEFEPTDVLALVQTTVKLMEPVAAEKGVNLTLETFNIQHSTFNLELEVDGRAIQQALVNLVDNAIKHSPPGETVTVELESGVRSPESGDASTLNSQPSTLNLSVSDHGPGIPPEEHERIFERFYRRGSELRRETQGVGIGLSIVKHIVEAHGGRVGVESRVGQGSRFTIELPFEK